MTRTRRNLTLALVLTVGAGLWWQGAGTGDAAQPSHWATVLHVRDGDTIVVDIDPPGLTNDPLYARFQTPNGPGTGIRFRGVNTFNGLAGPGDPVEDCWGQAATDFLRLPEGEPGGKLGLVGRRVRLVGSTSQSNVDAYGRLSMRTFVDEVDIAKIILKAGLGLPQPAMQLTDKQVTGYRKKAANAMSANRRIWRENKCGSGPHKNAELNIRVMWDADGDDAVNLSGEWVEVSNDSPLDSGIVVKLGGWQLRDADQSRLTTNPNDTRTYFTFPTRNLAPGEKVRVYGGTSLPPGAPPGSLSWGNTREIFLNRSEIVVLMDPDGDIRAYFDWPCDTALKTITSCDHPLKGKIALWAQYNPYGGPDQPEDEWVDIWNVSTGPVDLDGLFLRDDADTYLFDGTTIVQPNTYLRIRVGRGTDTGQVRFWGKTTLILQDSGDRVDLLDLSGREVACYGWGDETCKKADLDWNLRMVVNFDGEGVNGGTDTSPAEVANNEWIKIWNDGTVTRDLTGFLLEMHGELYPIPAGTVLPPGQRLMVRMGLGQNTTLDKYWRMSGTNVIPNALGTVNLWNPTFRRTATFTWPCEGSGCTPPPIVIDTHCPGIDNADTYEWVRLKNTSSQTVDLTDWWFKTSRHHHYYFPDGTTILPGATITVYVFSGYDTDDRLYWGKDEPIIKSPNATGGEVLEVYSWQSVRAHTYVSDTTQNPGSCGESDHAVRLVVNFDGEGGPTGSPAQPDPESPDTEWIRIWNDDDSALDLTGFRLEAPTGSGLGSFWLPSLSLPPGQSLKVVMGTGTNTTWVRHWGLSGSPVLPNAGSTNLVTLWDTEGHRAAVFNWVCDPTNCPPPDVKINGFCNTDPNDWVRIKNNSTQTVDLTDWWVKTSRHWHYYFPDGTLLPAGATIRLWTGTGTDTSTNLYWGLPSPIFKATGEIVQLFTSRSVLAGGDYAFDQYSGNC